MGQPCYGRLMIPRGLFLAGLLVLSACGLGSQEAAAPLLISEAAAQVDGADVLLVANVDSGSAPLRVSVDWGDGTSDVLSEVAPGAVSARHVYESAGGYTIVVEAATPEGQNRIATVEVSIDQPVAESPATPTTTQAVPGVGVWPEGAPEVLLGTTEGVFLNGGPYAAPGTGVVAVVDDLEGGVVYQTAAAPGDQTSRIWWLPAGSAEPVELGLGESGGFVGLVHSVAEIEGGRHLVVTQEVGGEGGEPEQYLEVHELDVEALPGRRVVQTGGIEAGAQSVSYAAGFFLVTEITHSCGNLALVNLFGERVVASALPEPPCEVNFEVPFLHGRLSPDGSLIAYIAQSFRFDEELGFPVVTRSDLVAVDRATGEELVRETVTDQATEEIVSMDFDGEWLVWVRRPPGDLPAGPVTGSQLFGLHLEGARFQVDLEGVTSVWLPGAPLQP